ncbi:tetratricopeptide repeat-containing sulfotransferase family protein [Pseudoalteromonas piratica]|uniref:Uncharacterized protein n=1 Tax=Pseudoalteromonas piratica TaxID=1348114 RepID=A0A0A7EGY4_9GAMM|nr:tetratricopeptide repeat-containing sulfotransferase family protein [Pseudoalteromonas piratica]AIY65884.1 hypothetical protein OM33_12670 [Pseudoalteromonas piratica]
MKQGDVKLTPHQANLLQKATTARRNKNYSEALSYVNDIFQHLAHYEPAILEAALILFETNNFDYAENVLQQLINSPYEAYSKHHALAVIKKNKRDFNRAISHYQQACQLMPTSVVDLLGMSFCFAQVGDLERAISVCKTELADKAAKKLLTDYLGNLYIQANQYDKAEALFEEMLNDDDSNAKAHYSLATINKTKGDITAAKSYYLKAVALNNFFIMAHYGLSVVTNYKTEGHKHLTQLESLWSETQLTQQDRILLAFSLAKANEQTGHFDKSFSYLKQGNDLRFSMLNYDVNSDLAFMENIKSVFTRKAVKPLQQFGSKSAKPIFIIGMPRSGTTLIEKIIGSHSDVYSAGEIETLFSAGCSLLNKQHYMFDDLASVNKEQVTQLTEMYLEKLSSLTNNHQFITDKLPLNFLMVGIIKILFPNAKIIHCQRNKKDTCLSIYKKNFSNDNYRFAYNLEALAHYYNGYEKLMAHWHREFPEEIIDVNYEQLAQNPEQEVPFLLEKCGLEWQQQCLEFYKTPSLVQTASAVQVREPMYTRTINLWQQYKEQLNSLIRLLN